MLALVGVGGVAAGLWSIDVPVREIALAILPFATTVLGATLALHISHHREEAAEHERRRIALNFAIFTLVRQWSAVEQCLKDFSASMKPHEIAFGIPAIKPPDYSGLRVQIESLAFLFGAAHAQLLMDVAIEQERFAVCMDVLRQRADFHVQELQPAIERTGINSRSTSLEETGSYSVSESTTQRSIKLRRWSSIFRPALAAFLQSCGVFTAQRRTLSELTFHLCGTAASRE